MGLPVAPGQQVVKVRWERLVFPALLVPQAKAFKALPESQAPPGNKVSLAYQELLDLAGLLALRDQQGMTGCLALGERQVFPVHRELPEFKGPLDFRVLKVNKDFRDLRASVAPLVHRD